MRSAGADSVKSAWETMAESAPAPMAKQLREMAASVDVDRGLVPTSPDFAMPQFSATAQSPKLTDKAQELVDAQSGLIGMATPEQSERLSKAMKALGSADKLSIRQNNAAIAKQQFQAIAEQNTQFNNPAVAQHFTELASLVDVDKGLVPASDGMVPGGGMMGGLGGMMGGLGSPGGMMGGFGGLGSPGGMMGAFGPPAVSPNNKE